MVTVKVEKFTKRIKKTLVLDHIVLEMHGGKIYGLKGRNGSGKTMLMRAISGLILPTEGRVVVDGQVLGRDISFPPSIGILLENPSFLDNYTGIQNLRMLASIKKCIGEEQIADALEQVGLEPHDKRTYRKYSLGMKQRLGIAAAIMESPDIIILDEPVNALDESGVLQVRDILKEHRDRGAIIVIACHDSEELQLLSDEIIEISEGRIVGRR